MTEPTFWLPPPARPVPAPPMLARLALESDRAELMPLFQAYLAEASPWLTFDEDAAMSTFERYLATANPTIFVCEAADRKLAGYFLATFNPYNAADGYFICQDELYAAPGADRARTESALSSAFEMWVEQLNPRPSEVMLGVEVCLVDEADRLPQGSGGGS